MRVATFNVLHGRSIQDGRVDGDRFAAAIAGLDADVMALQEVDRGQARSGNLDLPRIAAAAAGAVAWRFTPAAVRFGDRWVPARSGQDAGDGPAYGVVLLSRYRVSGWQEFRFPAAPMRSPVLLPGSGRIRLLRDEPRVAVVALVQAPTGPVTVAATHLSFVPGWNVGQLLGLARALRTLPAPRLLLGDFNIPGVLPGLLTGWTSLARAPTFPSPRPRVQIDHILGSGPLAPAGRASTPPTAISDHRPLVVDLGP
ncbi:MAG: endonuclease/exonuclease/phosphatase family protein [Mycobacteriales bacterium]